MVARLEKIKKQNLSFTFLKLIFRVVDKVEGAIMDCPLYVYVVLMGIVFITLPMFSFWAVFSVANYLPNPFRSVLIWLLLLITTMLAAAVDHARSH